ncbi:MAG: flagellar hook-associated protein FlgK [Alphaproteobacteria bacterium]|nr:flagellar hook-associated protein FlgK [Alphaproteobacteria bacterium]
MSLTLGLNAALSGLLTAQKGLEVASHNIANVNTVGYTRKTFNPESRVLGGIGVGVQVGAITRDVDRGLIKDMQRQYGVVGKLDIQDEYFQRMQDIFGRPGDNTSISHTISRVAAEFETLAADPSKSTQQVKAISTATEMTTQLNQMSEQVQTLRLEADRELETAIGTINELLTAISDLNDKIVRDGTLKTGTADLEDKRDQALLELSEYLDIQYFERSDGSMTVFTSQGATLVMSQALTVEHSAAVSVDASQSEAAGSFDGLTANGIDFTDSLVSGKLKGLLELRDNILPDLQAQIDQLTVQTRDLVNLAHNRGTGFPTLAGEITGSRTFLDGATQTMSIGSDDDVIIALVDSEGDQFAATTLRDIMVNTALAPAGLTYTNPWTMDDVATKLESWLQSAGLGSAMVEVNSEGKFQIDLESTSYGLVMRDFTTATNSTYRTDATAAYTIPAGGGGTLRIRDANGVDVTLTEGADFAGSAVRNTALTNMVNAVNGNAALTAAGISAQLVTDSAGVEQIEIYDTGGDVLTVSGTLTSAATLNTSRYDKPSTSTLSDVTVSFDSDGDGTTDKTLSGFSNFLGLNDLFDTTRANSINDTNVLSTRWSWTMAVPTTLNFSDSTNGIGYGTLSIANGSSLQDIADSVNNSATLNATAYVVPEGAGSRLRIVHNDGEEMQITGSDANGRTFLSQTGLGPSQVGVSAMIKVRDDIAVEPEKISRSVVQWNSDTKTWAVSNGDNAAINEIANTFTEKHGFSQAGGLSSASLALEDYATTILSNNAAKAEFIVDQIGYQSGLKTTLSQKNAEISGVNLDEELSRLIVWEQAYSAAAKVISTTQQMFDILTNMIR